MIRWTRSLSFGLLALTCLAIQPSGALAQTLAFEGAEGFGRFARGPRSNLAAAEVYHVTNLNDSGVGSFRDAVSQGNRYIVFDVGGIINLNSAVSVDKGGLYIAGQTAPGGISFYGAKVSFSGANNAIARHMGIRLGVAAGREDASGLSRGSNMIFDHMSFTWGGDETFSMNPASGQTINNITIQNSIIGQSLNNLNRSAGSLMTIGEGNHFSVITSLFADNRTRNPKVRGNNEFINNVVYGYESAGYIMGDTSATSNANVIGNYFIESTVDGSNTFTRGTSSFHIYAADNWVDENRNGILDGIPISNYPGANVISSPHDFPTVASMSAQEAVQFVLQNVGSNIIRDAVDTKILDGLASLGTAGGIINRESDLFPGWGTNPIYLNPRGRLIDSDNDGMPDNWELSRGLNPNNHNDFKVLVGGYTNLERYLNELGANGTARTSSGGAWTNSSSWGGSLPDFSSRVFVSGGISHSSGFGFARQLTMNGNSTMSGGTLDVFDTVRIGSGDLGTLHVTGGTLSAGRIMLGDAISGSGGILAIDTGATAQTGTIGSDGGSAWLIFNGGTFRAIGVPSITVPVTITAAGGTINTNGFSGAVSGKISGEGQLVKNGTGTLVLSGNNDFSGGIQVNGGGIGLTHANAAGTGPLRLNNATYLPTVSNITTPIEVLSTATITSGGLTIGGAITGAAGTTLNINTSSSGNSNTSLGGDLSGFAGAFNFSGSTGNIRIHRSGSALAAFELGSSTAQIRTSNGGDIHMGSLSGGATTRLAGATNSANMTNYVIGARNTNTTFNGTIIDGPFSGATTGITKTGIGTLTLGAANTYTGATVVQQGTLIVNGNTGSGMTTVFAGATLGGSGVISGGLNVLGQVAPGNSTGKLTVEALANFLSGSSLTMELDDENNYDQFVVNGELNIGDNVTLNILVSSLIPQAGQSFRLLNWQSINGQFATINLPTLSDGYTFDISKLYGSGVISIAVPEPSVGLMLSMATVAFLRRRRNFL